MTGGEAATIHLDTPLPGASSGLPAGSGEQPSNACATATRLRPSWPCFGWGLPSHSGHPECWCALTAPFHPYPLRPKAKAAVCFLWHFPASCLGLPLAITLLCEVRTFLEHRQAMSAAARPTRPRDHRTLITMVQVPPARHLLRARDLVDARSARWLTVGPPALDSGFRDPSQATASA